MFFKNIFWSQLFKPGSKIPAARRRARPRRASGGCRAKPCAHGATLLGGASGRFWAPGGAQQGPQVGAPTMQKWLKQERSSLCVRDFSKSFLCFFVPFLGPPGAEIWPKCGPRDQLSNHKVSSKSGQWRPDSWQKTAFKTSSFDNSFSARCFSTYSECRSH